MILSSLDWPVGGPHWERKHPHGRQKIHNWKSFSDLTFFSVFASCQRFDKEIENTLSTELQLVASAQKGLWTAWLLPNIKTSKTHLTPCTRLRVYNVSSDELLWSWKIDLFLTVGQSPANCPPSFQASYSMDRSEWYRSSHLTLRKMERSEVPFWHELWKIGSRHFEEGSRTLNPSTLSHSWTLSRRAGRKSSRKMSGETASGIWVITYRPSGNVQENVQTSVHVWRQFIFLSIRTHWHVFHFIPNIWTFTNKTVKTKVRVQFLPRY